MMYSFLLVEDDEVDVITIKRAFKKANIINSLHVAGNGLEALDLLRGENGQKNLKQPLIVLLDLNMPKMNGLEFLTEIRKDDELKSLPVVVLTSSANDEDIVKAYGNNVAGYLLKPVGMEQFVEKMAILGKYWSLCEL